MNWFPSPILSFSSPGLYEAVAKGSIGQPRPSDECTCQGYSEVIQSIS